MKTQIEQIDQLRSMRDKFEHEYRGSGPDWFEVERFLEWAEKQRTVEGCAKDPTQAHAQSISRSITPGMHPLSMIAEWRKGCSCASPAHPEECLSCTRGLIDALQYRMLAFDPPPNDGEKSAASVDERIESTATVKPVTAGTDMMRDALENAAEPIIDDVAAIDRLLQIEKQVVCFLEYCPFAIRVREGGGPENLAQSLALTVAKIDDEMMRLHERLAPGDHTALAARLPRVRPDFLAEVQTLPVSELIRRVLIQSDWIGSYARSLDGLDLTINGRPIGGSGIDGARTLTEIRAIVEAFIAKLKQKDELIEALTIEKERLYGLINSPQIENFLEAIKLEAAHQRERWGSDHDAGKGDVDWLFLVGYLGGKAVEAGKAAELIANTIDSRELIDKHRDRRLHHIVAAGAAALNWHEARSGGDNRMRPGIAPPLELQGESPIETVRRGLQTAEEIKRKEGTQS